VKGACPIARETARQIACDCSVSTHTTVNGEPAGIGRRSRLWPNAMARAIRNRDQHCQFYGCTQTHNLQIHHIKHWADGGTTCVSNGVCIRQKHHTMVHEGGYSIQPVASSEDRLNDQFSMQQHADNTSMFNVEKELRNDRESFNTVRKLSPTKYRFRVFNADGQDIRSKHSAFNCKPVITSKPGATDINEEQFGLNTGLPSISKLTHPLVSSKIHSTRVNCAEPVSDCYYCKNRPDIHGRGDDGVLRMGRLARSRVFKHSAYSTAEKRNVYNVSPFIAH
jgi:hypothetical protein